MHRLTDKQQRPIKLGYWVQSKDLLTGIVIGCPGDGQARPEDRRHDQVTVRWQGSGEGDHVKASDLVVIPKPHG